MFGNTTLEVQTKQKGLTDWVGSLVTTVPGEYQNYNNKDDQERMKNMTAMKEKKDLSLEILLGHITKIIV